MSKILFLFNFNLFLPLFLFGVEIREEIVGLVSLAMDLTKNKVIVLMIIQPL